MHLETMRHVIIVIMRYIVVVYIPCTSQQNIILICQQTIAYEVIVHPVKKCKRGNFYRFPSPVNSPQTLLSMRTEKLYRTQWWEPAAMPEWQILSNQRGTSAKFLSWFFPSIDAIIEQPLLKCKKKNLFQLVFQF